MERELGHEAVLVECHSACRDIEPRADLFHGPPLGEKLEHQESREGFEQEAVIVS
jgi:hypothetical protein